MAPPSRLGSLLATGAIALFFGWAALLFLIVVCNGLPVMIFEAGSDHAKQMARGTVSATTFALIGVWLWYRPVRARGWRNVLLGLTVFIIVTTAVLIALDLLFGGLIANGGDVTKIGNGPLVRFADWLTEIALSLGKPPTSKI